MFILINCKMLNDFDIAEIESRADGRLICWTYVKLMLWMKEGTLESFPLSRANFVASKLGFDSNEFSSHLKTLLEFPKIAYTKNYNVYLPEITRELATLKGRLKGALKQCSVSVKKTRSLIIKKEEPKPKPEKLEIVEDVFLTKEEIVKLEAQFPKIDFKKLAEELSDYMGSSGKRYQDHYKTLRAWARRRQNEPQNNYPTQSPTPTQNLTQKDFLKLPNWMKKEAHLEALERKIDEEEAAKDNLKTVEIENDKPETNVQLVKNLIFDISKRRAN